MPRLVSNPPNPWAGPWVDYIGPPPAARLEVYEEDARSILSRNESPDVPFLYSVNPYRGCQHACAYCYARSTHRYLDFGAGTDFEKKIVVKRNAPELLSLALARRGWRRDWVAFSGVTDAYQPLEAAYGLTRRCLEVCRARANPVGVITKSALIRRDAGLLAEIHRVAGASVHVSIPLLRPELARAIEPAAASPRVRLDAIAALADAGVPVGVALAPVIPALGDEDIPAVLEAARDAGATSAFMILLRLTREVRPVFEARLREAFPERASHVLAALEDCRSDVAPEQRTAFGQRMRGAGPRWSLLEQLFRMHCRRLGLAASPEQEPRPLRMGQTAPVQKTLFDS